MIDELCLQFTHYEEIEGLNLLNYLFYVIMLWLHISFLKGNQSLNEAICRKWSLQQMEEFAVQVRFLLYDETKQHDQIKKYCEVFLDIHKVSSWM